jgi:hypothetical protein
MEESTIYHVCGYPIIRRVIREPAHGLVLRGKRKPHWEHVTIEDAKHTRYYDSQHPETECVLGCPNCCLPMSPEQHYLFDQPFPQTIASVATTLAGEEGKQFLSLTKEQLQETCKSLLLIHNVLRRLMQEQECLP